MATETEKFGGGIDTAAPVETQDTSGDNRSRGLGLDRLTGKPGVKHLVENVGKPAVRIVSDNPVKSIAALVGGVAVIVLGVIWLRRR